ncbi:hypothetical protein HZC34_04075 [Candidatus Saganbacteria bacterium]|nr:hypothetical protein [Candidatus Saganbacteria bacterium]
MASGGTEAKVLDVIARLKFPDRRQICRALGISIEYVDYLLNYLRRKGRLLYNKGRYFLPGARRRKVGVLRKIRKKRKPGRKKKR